MIEEFESNHKLLWGFLKMVGESRSVAISAQILKLVSKMPRKYTYIILANFMCYKMEKLLGEETCSIIARFLVGGTATSQVGPGWGARPGTGPGCGRSRPGPWPDLARGRPPSGTA